MDYTFENFLASKSDAFRADVAEQSKKLQEDYEQKLLSRKNKTEKSLPSKTIAPSMKLVKTGE